MPHPNAVLWKRLFATLYDLLILTAISLLYGAIATLISTVLFNNAASEFKPNAEGFMVQLGWVLTITGFYCFFWLRVGQTVAMKAWKLRLVTTTGTQLTLRHCLVRCITGFLGFACFGISYLWAIIDSEKLALHDRISGTKVIQLNKKEA